jgi:hypothetical protein
MLAALPLWVLPAPPPEAALNQFNLFRIGLNKFRDSESLKFVVFQQF